MRGRAPAGTLDLLFLGGGRLTRAAARATQQAKAGRFARLGGDLRTRLRRRRFDRLHAQFAKRQLALLLRDLEVRGDFGARGGRAEVLLLEAERIDVVRERRRGDQQRGEDQNAFHEVSFRRWLQSLGGGGECFVSLVVAAQFGQGRL